jgi:hypothetical protein
MGSVVDDVGQPDKHNTSSEVRMIGDFFMFRSFLCPTGLTLGQFLDNNLLNFGPPIWLLIHDRSRQFFGVELYFMLLFSAVKDCALLPSRPP